MYEQKVLLILIGMFVIASFCAPYFLTFQNINNLIMQISIYGIMAFAMTFVILIKEFDLSIGAVMAFSGIFLVKMSSYTGMMAAILITLLAGALIGLLSGLLVSVMRLNSFIVTLCAMFFYNGLALKISSGKPIMTQDPILNWLGNETTLWIPNLIWIFVIFYVISEYVLRKTKYGRNVYAVGGDVKVAELTGIAVPFYKISVFVISGVSASMGGILLTGMLNSASPFVGGAAALTVISSVVIGGTSLAGGEGSATRAVMGLFILGILDNSLALLNVQSFYQALLKGILLVVVIGWDYYVRKARVAHAV
ncbi:MULTISPECIES: ABC transporter permease [Paenibacillus]|uniref:ABC transporter permease n=1 Tax=Paenibacillus TaxID=44249 RepID=UPI0018C27403|nr:MULTISPECIES: ABC transporter permease [Paenibacillus]